MTFPSRFDVLAYAVYFYKFVYSGYKLQQKVLSLRGFVQLHTYPNILLSKKIDNIVSYPIFFWYEESKQTKKLLKNIQLTCYFMVAQNTLFNQEINDAKLFTPIAVFKRFN